jgi:transposase
MVGMYITRIPNRNSPPAVLLRESYRENGKVKTRTLSNLSHLPPQAIDLITRSLKGEKFISTTNDFEKVRSWHHGHVDAVLRAIKSLDFERLICSRRCKERDLVVAMVVGRILEPDNEQNSKLANTRWWEITTLPAMLDVQDADEVDLYASMDWLLDRQEAIEKKLAKRHLSEGGLVLWDLTSSYFEGVTCPLAYLGHNRDGKKGKLQVNYGIITDNRGCPVAVEAFEGNTLDHETVTSQAKKIRDQFGIKTMVLVGDRGMITQKLIDNELRGLEGVNWITALKSGAIYKLVKNGEMQLGLFDEINLAQITSTEYPKERLVVCRNPHLAKQRALKRQALLTATKEKLDESRAIVEGGKLRGKDKINRQLDSIVKKYKMGDEICFNVHDDGFDLNIQDKQKTELFLLDVACKEIESIGLCIKNKKYNSSQETSKAINKILAKYNLSEHISVIIGQDGLDFRIENKADAATAALKHVRQLIDGVSALVKCGKYGGKAEIGVRVGKIINKYKVSKHFILDIRDDGFDYRINQEKVDAESALDGFYVIRTSLPDDKMSAEDTVRNYKSLSQVERAFRSMKTVDLKVRPIRHHLERRVRTHIFLCMLAYYVEWHMREAWRPLLFCDEDQERKKSRDPVAPAKRSIEAKKKVFTKILEDGSKVNSFQTLLKSLSQIVRNECRVRSIDSDAPIFEMLTTPSSKQQQAYDLLATITV